MIETIICILTIIISIVYTVVITKTTKTLTQRISSELKILRHEHYNLETKLNLVEVQDSLRRKNMSDLLDTQTKVIEIIRELHTNLQLTKELELEDPNPLGLKPEDNERV